MSPVLALPGPFLWLQSCQPLMSRRYIASMLLLLLVAGCGGASARDRPPILAGEVDAPPSMEVLPSLDVPLSSLSRHMRFAWLLTEQTFQVSPPAPAPADGTADQIRDWGNRDLEPWLAKKSHMVEAAREELNIAAEENHRQRILAGALVGLMYEDIARVLLGIPVPSDLRDDPEIASDYRDVRRFEASSYLGHAKRAYHACALNAVQPATMHAWSEFCAGRAAGLPLHRPGRPGQSSTSVSVSVD